MPIDRMGRAGGGEMSSRVKPKLGRRPRTGAAADRRVTIRLDAAEAGRYEQAAAQAGQTLGAWLRAAAEARLVALALLSMAACGPTPVDHHWALDAGVAPTLSASVAPDQLSAWTVRVETDLDYWNNELQAAGCDARLHVDSDAPVHVQLVARVDWPAIHAGAVGYWDETSGDVLILAQPNDTLDRYYTSDTWHVGQHEIGHALGLAHTSPVDGPSVMVPAATYAISPRDVAAILCPTSRQVGTST